MPIAYFFVASVSRETTINKFYLLAIVANGLPYAKKMATKKPHYCGFVV